MKQKLLQTLANTGVLWGSV